MHLLELRSLVARSPTAGTKRLWPPWRRPSKLSEHKMLEATWSQFVWALYKNAVSWKVNTFAKLTPKSSAWKRPHDLSMVESQVLVFVQYPGAQDRDRTPSPRFSIMISRYNISSTHVGLSPTRQCKTFIQPRSWYALGCSQVWMPS